MKGYQSKKDIKNKTLPKGDFGRPYEQNKTLPKGDFGRPYEQNKFVNKQLKLYYFGIKYIERGNTEQLYYHKICDEETANDTIKLFKTALKKQLNIPEKDILKSWFHPVKHEDFVICIDDSVEGISKNKIYKIEYESVKYDGVYYDIMDDYGIMNQFRAYRFYKINN